MFYIYLGTKNPKNSHPNLFFTEGINCLICQSKFRSLYPQSWNNFVPLYSTSISDRKRRKPHLYDSRLFIYIFWFFSLASEWFWTFLLFFLALCPFSPARLRISLWFPDVFGLFYCFSRPYVHFHLLSSVFLSSFTFILDFFPCFSLLYVHFHLLSSVFPSGFTFILDFFPIFLSFMSIWKSTEVSGLRNAALRRIKRSAITPFLFQKLLSQLPS